MGSTTRCPHCGTELEPMRFDLGGTSVTVGYEPCGCPEACAERLAAAQAEAAREDSRRRERLEARYRKAGIPERYRSAEHPSAEAMASSAQCGTGFYVTGPAGTGKTHLAMAVARILVARGASVRVEVAPALVDGMRSRTSEDREKTLKLAKAEVLVIDDLGKESPTPYACERLFDLVNERYNAMLPVIVTSNYSRSQLVGRLLEGAAGRSIASRLAEMTRLVRLEGVDRRVCNG